jgi:ribonuclease HI
MHIEVFCDGSATTADKPGGYAFVILVDGIKYTEASGHIPKATNNVAELTAAISGLEYVKQHPSLSGAKSITLISDSQLALKYASGEYRCRKPHLVPLYCKLRQLYIKMNITTKWVKGHSGDIFNEQCDVLAKAAREGAVVTPNDRRLCQSTTPFEDTLLAGDHE